MEIISMKMELGDKRHVEWREYFERKAGDSGFKI